MECGPAVSIRTAAISHKLSSNDPVYKHMICPLHLPVTGNQYSPGERERERQFPESDAEKCFFVLRRCFWRIFELFLFLIEFLGSPFPPVTGAEWRRATAPTLPH